MKNLLIFILIISTIFIAFNIEGCQKKQSNSDESSVNIEQVSKKIDNLIQAIDENLEVEYGLYKKSLVADKDLGLACISFLVVMNKTTGEVALTNFEKLNLIDITGGSERSLGGRKQYIVHCSGGSGGSWKAKCRGKLSCGKKIAKCLDEGRCAKICEAPTKLVDFNGADFFRKDDLKRTLPDIDIGRRDEVSAVELFYTDM